jgi:hypothetical protein
MASLTEGKYAGEFLISEAPGTLSRENGTVDVPATTTIEPGTVLGQLSGTGHYAPYDDANTDGTETAAAILAGARLVNDGALVDSQATALIVRLAEVRADDLVWGAGVDEAGGATDLAAAFIVAR